MSSRSTLSSRSSDAFTYGACTEETRNHPRGAPFCDVAQSRNTACIASMAVLSRSTTSPSCMMYPSPLLSAACISTGETSRPIASNVYETSNAPPGASRTVTTGTTDGMESVSSISLSARSTRHPRLLSAGSPAPRKSSTFCGSTR